MAIDKAPNSDEERDYEFLHKVKSLTDNVGTASFQGVKDFSNYVSGNQNDLMDLLSDLTYNIDTPILKLLAKDMIGVLGSFYLDDSAMCCLIRNILIQLGLQSQLEDYNNWVHELIDNDGRGVDGIYINEDNFELVVDETKFGQVINSLIVVIDIILTFIDFDINDLIMPAFDFIRTISEAVVGFVCIALQEILFTLRDGTINFIIQQIDEAVGTDSWAECLPYMDFIGIIKKYIHDYGMTKRLQMLLEGFLGNLFNKFNKAKKKELAKNVKIKEFLVLIKKILENIKQAVVSWEFCIFLSNDPEVDGEVSDDDGNPYFHYLKDILTDPNNTSGKYGANDFIFADDNTILNNNDNGNTGTGPGKSNEDNSQNSGKPPIDDEILAFLQNYMGMSSERATGLVSDNGLNTGDGSSGTSSSCGSVLQPEDISSILDTILNNSRIG